MNFIWFWTFWHWSRESFRQQALLRSPLQGIGGHWDEWFRHEASENDLRAIAKTGQSEISQRQFVGWLLRHWARECGFSPNRLAGRFVLGQLAQVQPFNQWAVFEKYRHRYGLGGVSAIVLAGKSLGEPDDVRMIEALLLPADAATPSIVTEGFQAESAELETPLHAAISLLTGRGFLTLFALWLAAGKRAYPQWIKAALNLGWIAVGGLILYLLAGPDPGENLLPLCATLLALWGGLVITAMAFSLNVGLQAWRQGQDWCARLTESQLLLRMNGGLILKGGSAGLPFCLNMLLALHRGRPPHRSWLWRRIFQKMQRDGKIWAATGLITVNGRLKPIVVEPKLRACLQREGIKNILTPRQAGVVRGVINRFENSQASSQRESEAGRPYAGAAQLGFATEQQFLRVHPCRHVAQVLMRVGDLTSAGQVAMNVAAIAISLTMLFALPGLRGVLLPPVAPIAVAPASPSPKYLWVSLNTKYPRSFQVALESPFWANRRAEVAAHGGASGSVRAEISLHPLDDQPQPFGNYGVVWVERRYWFLNREFAPGERVGRYSLSYLTDLGYE